MAIKNTENNKRIVKNTMLLYVRMFFMMVISLYTSRVVLATLGVNDFGIYNIVSGVVVLFSFLNTSMVQSTQRFLNFEMGRGDMKEVKRIFSMSINCQILIIILLLVFSETIGLWVLNTFLKIPSDRMLAANWIYQFSILSTCFGIFHSPYNAAIIAYEKMEIYAYLSIIEVILKLSVVYLLVIWNFDKLIFYGFLMLLVLIFITSLYIIYCIKKIPICEYKYFWDKCLFHKLITFSGWSLFGSVANVGINQGLSIIQNLFFGVTINAAMGVAQQVNTAIAQFLSNFATAYNPQIVKSYSSDDRDFFVKLLFQTSKFSFFLIFLLGFPIIVCCQNIMKIWLGHVPQHASSFCVLMILFNFVDAPITPLWMAVQAYGKIKKYQIYISFIKLLVMPISIIGLLLGAKPEFVLFVNFISNIGLYIYRIYFLNSIGMINANEYVKKVIYPIFYVVLAVTPVPIIMQTFLTGYEWIGNLLFTVILTIFCIFYLGMSVSERHQVRLFVFNKLKSR